MPTAAATHLPLPPGPKGIPFLGQLLQVWRDPLDLLLEGMREHGDTVALRFGPRLYVVLNRPDDVRHVLLGNAQNYPKSKNYDGLRLVLGEGLVTSEGELWKRQRKLANPAFHHARLIAFGETMARCTTDMLDRWDRERPGELDVHDALMKLTLRIVGLTLFSTELSDHAGDLARAVDVLRVKANEVAEDVIVLPPWVPTPRNLAFRRAMHTLDGIVNGVVDARRRSGDLGEDLLGMLMAATDEAGGMSRKQLRDEVVTLMLAGHETTAVALSWTFLLLSRHPDVARKLAAEVDEVLGDRAAPVFEDLPKLRYTGWVVDEAMRLYPPVWMVERQALADDVIGGYRIPRGTYVGVSPWTLHRHPAYWENPEGFEPERFAPEREKERPRYVYLPFGGGPRTCIGNSFALMEAKILLATIAKRYTLALRPGERPELDSGVTLRPKKGIHVQPRRRATIAT